MINKFVCGSTSCALFIALVAIISCGSSKNMAKLEEDYSMKKYKDKMDRPSPPARTQAQIGSATVSVDFSQPGVKEREIWGKLVKYDKMWRTGANEANVFETSHPVLINKDTLFPGKYSLFTIPSKDKWIVILNKVYDQWGTYDYNQSEDAVRLEVVPYLVDTLEERMNFSVDSLGKVGFAWEYLRFDFDVSALNSD